MLPEEAQEEEEPEAERTHEGYYHLMGQRDGLSMAAHILRTKSAEYFMQREDGTAKIVRGLSDSLFEEAKKFQTRVEDYRKRNNL